MVSNTLGINLLKTVEHRMLKVVNLKHQYIKRKQEQRREKREKEKTSPKHSDLCLCGAQIPLLFHTTKLRLKTPQLWRVTSDPQTTYSFSLSIVLPRVLVMVRLSSFPLSHARCIAYGCSTLSEHPRSSSSSLYSILRYSLNISILHLSILFYLRHHIYIIIYYKILYLLSSKHSIYLLYYS